MVHNSYTDNIQIMGNIATFASQRNVAEILERLIWSSTICLQLKQILQITTQ